MKRNKIKLVAVAMVLDTGILKLSHSIHGVDARTRTSINVHLNRSNWIFLWCRILEIYQTDRIKCMEKTGEVRVENGCAGFVLDKNCFTTLICKKK